MVKFPQGDRDIYLAGCSMHTSHQGLCPLHQALQWLWQLDEIGILERNTSAAKEHHPDETGSVEVVWIFEGANSCSRHPL